MVENLVLRPINTPIKGIFAQDEKYTFLVGAGISMERPTSLPSAFTIVETLIRMCAPAEEVDKVLKLNNLRYELVVETIQKHFDPELKIMGYFEHFNVPNILHYFLAQTIKQEHYVVTTNFDYLIEHALLSILEDKSIIIPVITRKEFLAFSDPQKLLNDGKYPLYKLHGSKRNIITGKQTTNSLITTLYALGREREEGETFAIEPYKKPAVNKLLEDRTLVVMGYSGSDDFDIGPTLKELHNTSKVIWISHASESTPEILTIEQTADSLDIADFPREDRLLLEIAHESRKRKIPLEIYKINVNTAVFVTEILWSLLLKDTSQPDLNNIPSSSLDLEKWLATVLSTENLVKKYMLVWDLYFRLSQPEDALRIGDKGREIAEKMENLELISTFLNNNGTIYMEQGNTQEALEHYDKALKLGDIDRKAMTLNNIGMIYKSQQNYQTALEWFEQALEIVKKSEDLSERTVILTNIGLTYYAQNNLQLALEYYEEALKTNEPVGDLFTKAKLLSNIGSVYFSQNNLEMALKQFEEALEIAKQLGDLTGNAIRLNNIAAIHASLGNQKAAIKGFEQALEISEQLGELDKKAIYLRNIGRMYKDLGDFQSALEYFEEAVPIDEQLGNLEAKYRTLDQIAMIYYKQDDLLTALSLLREAVQTAVQIGQGSSSEVTDMKFAIDRFTEQLGKVIELEQEVNRWKQNEIDKVAKIEEQISTLNIHENIQAINTNPFIIEKWFWDLKKGELFVHKLLEKLEKEEKETEELLIAKGFILRTLDQNDLAGKCFDQVVKTQPKSSMALAGLASLKINAKNYDEAWDILNQAQSYDSKNAFIVHSIGNIFFKQQNLKAEEYLKQALEIDPNFIASWNSLGIIQFSLRNYSEAEKYWKKVVELEPDYLKIYFNLGLLYYTLQNYPEAEKYYKKVLELKIKDISIWNALALTYLRSGQDNEGEWCYKQLLDLDSSYTEAWSNLGNLYYNQRKFIKAVKYLEKTLVLDSKRGSTWKFLGISYRQLQNYNESAKCFEKVVELDPRDADGWHWLGMSYIELGKRNEADRCYEMEKKLRQGV
ncbi:MAG: tetratricopeptide repeat protein [Candidatus Hermodarchaeota archaeon]